MLCNFLNSYSLSFFSCCGIDSGHSGTERKLRTSRASINGSGVCLRQSGQGKADAGQPNSNLFRDRLGRVAHERCTEEAAGSRRLDFVVAILSGCCCVLPSKSKHPGMHAEYGVTAYLRRPAGTRLVPNQRFLQTTLKNVESGNPAQHWARLLCPATEYDT